MLRFVTLVGAVAAAAAPFLSGGAARWRAVAVAAGCRCRGPGFGRSRGRGGVGRRLGGRAGRDGREDWRYARRGAHGGALVASVDRKSVVATFRSWRDTRRHLMVVLDADTGRVRFERLVRAAVAEVEDIVPAARSAARRRRWSG